MALLTRDPRIRLSRPAARGDRLSEAKPLHLGYLAHFQASARYAARHAALAALQTESAPDEALNFFDWPIEDQLRRFAAEPYTKDGAPPRVNLRIVADRIASLRLSRRKEAA